MPEPQLITSPVATSPRGWRYPSTQTPDADFYTTFQLAYAKHQGAQGAQADGVSATDDLAVKEILGAEHVERRMAAGVGYEAQASYAAVLNKAYASHAMDDPGKFLQTLSLQEMETLRINHGLADSISVAGLSKEGASNLLLPAGYSVDLNHDGLEEIGAARTMHFPPRDAPAEFVAKWQEITAGMDPGDVMTYSFEMHTAIYGIHIDDQPSPVARPSDKIESYRAAVQNLLENVEMSKPYNTPEWYERTKAFYNRLQGMIGRPDPV